MVVGWKKEEDSEQKKQRGWKLENRSGVAKLRTENSRPTGSPIPCKNVKVLIAMLHSPIRSQNE